VVEGVGKIDAGRSGHAAPVPEPAVAARLILKVWPRSSRSATQADS
jgi:hypothetical protein